MVLMKYATTVYCKIFMVKGLKMKGLKMGHVSLILVVALLILAGAAGATGLATLAGVTTMSTSSPENILDWPMFHHDPARGGYSESRAPSSSNLKWNFGTGGQVFSSPAIMNDMVYFGALDGKVYCLDAENGAPIWSFTTGAAVYSSPAVAYDKVYVGSRDYKVYCLNAENGVYIWSFVTDSGVDSSPAVVNGKVYVGSYPRIYCLDAENGALVWSFTTGGRVDSSPAVVDGRVYVGSYDDNVYCLDAENGALKWSFKTGDLVYSSPTVAYGKVFLGSKDRKVYCFNAENGALVWSFTMNAGVFSSPAVADGKVYVGSRGNNYGSIYCLNAENGASIWDFATGGSIFSSPAVADSKVYVGSYYPDHRVYCFGITYGVSVSISPSYQRGPPGGTLDYTVTVVNMGGDKDTFTLGMGDNSGWTLMLSENLLENVQPGENRVVMLSVTIPENAENCTKDNVTVTAVSRADNKIKASGSCIAHATFVKAVIYPTADVYAFGGYSRAQMKFDISGIPAGSNIFLAKLWLCRFAADGWDDNVVLTRVNDQVWDETITANEFDAQVLTDGENYVGKFRSHGWDNLDVLNQLKVDHGAGHAYTSFRLRWVNDSESGQSIGVNDGRFLAIESQSDNLLIVFYSSEYDSQDPYLEVTYVPP